jgi:hypothetical protein
MRNTRGTEGITMEWQFAWLKKEFHYHTKLRAAYMAKLIIVSILVAAAVAFAVCLQVKKDVGGEHYSLSAFGGGN